MYQLSWNFLMELHRRMRYNLIKLDKILTRGLIFPLVSVASLQGGIDILSSINLYYCDFLVFSKSTSRIRSSENFKIL